MTCSMSPEPQPGLQNGAAGEEERACREKNLAIQKSTVSHMTWALDEIARSNVDGKPGEAAQTPMPPTYHLRCDEKALRELWVTHLTIQLEIEMGRTVFMEHGQDWRLVCQSPWGEDDVQLQWLLLEALYRDIIMRWHPMAKREDFFWSLETPSASDALVMQYEVLKMMEDRCAATESDASS